MSWKWRIMQNLKRNWLVISKSTWGIWWILTQALESLKNVHFNVLLLRQVFIVWAKKYREVIFQKIEEGYKIWRGINLLFENCHKEIIKFWPEYSKVSKSFTLMASFWAKYVLFELKKYGRVIFHDSEEWCKIWRKTDLMLGKWQEEFCKFSPEHTKCQNWNFNKILLPKVENVWASNLLWSYVSW